MSDLKRTQRRRARLPSNWCDPTPPDKLREHLPKSFEPDWARLEAAALASEHLTLRSVGASRFKGRTFDLLRAQFIGPKSGGDPIRLALIAGLQATETRCRNALIGFLLALCKQPFWANGVEVFAYPFPNASAFEEFKTSRPARNHLASTFWSGADQPEVYFLERELGIFQFHGVIVLEDVPRDGGIGIHLDSSVLRAAFMAPLREVADRILPSTVPGLVIGEGSAASELVDSPEIPSRPFGLTISLPTQPSADQVELSAVAVLEVLLERYMVVLAQGQNL